MKRKLRGMRRMAMKLDFSLYRVEVPVRDVAGASLSVIDMWPEGVEKTVMFVHGYAGCAETWQYQINHFATDYRVVVPDLRGHGQSDAPYTRYTMDEITADLHTIVETLALPERFVLVGHSFGGSICVEYANRHPERLEKLVLIATAGEYPVPRLAMWAFRIPTAFYRLLWDYRPAWNADVHVMKRMMLNNMRHWKGWPKFRNITTPALVLTGERDTYFPRFVYDEVGKVVPGAEVYDVGAAKHKIQLERHEAVNRAIQRFISNERRSWRDQIAESLQERRPWLSSYPGDSPHTIPLPRQPLPQFLESAASWHPKRTAAVFYGSRLSYRQLNCEVNRFAHALRGLGVSPGDRVMLVMPNTPHFITAYYATLRAGGVVVLPNPDADARDVVRQAGQTRAKVLVTLAAFYELAGAVKQNARLEHVIFADLRDMIAPNVYRKLIAAQGLQEVDYERVGQIGHLMSALVEDAHQDAPRIDVRYDDLAVIAYTSGTTDEPKGVCLTHANLVANTLQARHWIPDLHYGKETFLSVLPFMHSYGMTTAMNIPIAMAATIVMLPVFELHQVLEHIKQYRPTIFPGVPSMYTAINHAPNVRSYGLDSIKACISGSAPLPVEVQEEFEKLTRGRLVEGYGLTEAGPITHANPLFGVRKVGSIGVPLPNTDAKIVDAQTGEAIAPGQIGELVVKGPQVMRGYWDDTPEADPESALKHGWLYTGDLAVMDADGYFHIVSRKRDTIMAGDYSVYPRDVEEVLYENSKVLEAAVVGVDIDDGKARGQRVKAFVVPRPGTRLSKEELLELCRRRLDDYMVPVEIEFRESLPKSFIGKVVRRLLVEDNTRLS